MRLVLIGGTGYIGSRLFTSLVERGHTVDTVDLEWFGNYVNPLNIKCDYDDLPADFWQSYDVILLFSGHSSVPMCLGKLSESFQNNVVKFVNLLTKIGERKLIYASSSSVYGDTGNTPAKEDWPQFVPSNYYDLTKKISDMYAGLAVRNYYALRMGTLAGCSPNLRTDIMINKMYNDGKTQGKISVYNKSLFRPILGMNDLCRAVTFLVENDISPGVYNLASFNSSIENIVNSVASKIDGVEIIDNGISKSYDFSIDTSKFCIAANFLFEDTIASILESLDQCFESSNKGIRI